MIPDLVFILSLIAVNGLFALPEIGSALKKPVLVPESVSVTSFWSATSTGASSALSPTMMCSNRSMAISPPTAVQEEEGGWIIDGMLPFGQLREIIGVVEIPGEESLFRTTGGFVMMHLERVPEPGDLFDWAGFRFTVLGMDGKRVDRVRVETANAVENRETD
ncbi:MAG: transporter associated domain-containing protein [Methanoculleaceae archaeon]